MRAKRVRGFSLIEVMFGVFLALICALVFAATIPVANVSRAKAQLNDRATALATKQLERIVARGYGLIDDNDLATDRTSQGQPRLIEAVSDGVPVVIATSPPTYRFTNIDVENRDSPAMVLPGGEGFVILEQTAVDIRRITVEVRWQERGQTRSVRVGTQVGNV